MSAWPGFCLHNNLKNRSVSCNQTWYGHCMVVHHLDLNRNGVGDVDSQNWSGDIDSLV